MKIRNIPKGLKKRCEDKDIDLLLIEGRGKKHYFHTKDFNTCMITHRLLKKTFLLFLFTSF